MGARTTQRHHAGCAAVRVRLSQAAQCATLLLAPPRPPGGSYAMPFGAAKPAWRPNTRACHQTPTRARRPDCPLTFDVSRLLHFPTGATHDTQYHPRPQRHRPQVHLERTQRLPHRRGVGGRMRQRRRRPGGLAAIPGASGRRSGRAGRCHGRDPEPGRARAEVAHLRGHVVRRGHQRRCRGETQRSRAGLVGPGHGSHRLPRSRAARHRRDDAAQVAG